MAECKRLANRFQIFILYRALTRVCGEFSDGIADVDGVPCSGVRQTVHTYGTRDSKHEHIRSGTTFMRHRIVDIQFVTAQRNFFAYKRKTASRCKIDSSLLHSV